MYLGVWGEILDELFLDIVFIIMMICFFVGLVLGIIFKGKLIF